MPSQSRVLTSVALVATVALAAALPAQAQSRHATSPSRTTAVKTVTSDLMGPRGVDAVSKRKIFVTQADGTFSKVVRRLDAPAKVVDLGKVPNTGLAPAIARIHARLKAGFDPAGIFNPGRMY